MKTDQNCQCACGHAKFRVSGQPILRAYCHCTICQSFNHAPYADITLFRPGDVEMPAADLVEYKTLRPPPAVQRGVCASCGKPAIEYLQIFPMPKLVIVPSANIRDTGLVPTPSLHIFYNRRVADIDDGLPKYEGYWKSQLAFGRHLIGALLHKKS